MSILIKGMKMPSKCIECRLLRRCGKYDLDYVCMPANVYVEDLTNAYRPRPEYCPLIELPPHGDLIDRDALMKKDVPFNGHWDENDGRFHCYPPTYMQAVDDIRVAPTVISAEEG